MDILARAHFLHRAWRYRLRSERLSLSFLFSRDLKGRTAVDIGAHRGVYSYWMHNRVGRRGQVVAFEPQPELAVELESLKKSFNLRRLEICSKGLSSACGELILRRPPDHWGGASLEARRNQYTDCEDVRTEITTLDAHFSNHAARPLAFIKCDVEGHEYDVFSGGRGVLTEDRPELLFECYDGKKSECRTFALLEELGYQGYCFYKQGLAPLVELPTLKSRLPKKALVDYVFLPQEKAEPTQLAA